MPKCDDVKSLIEDRAKEKSNFSLLALLTRMHLECLQSIESKNHHEFPKEQEEILYSKIKNEIKRLKADLIILHPKGLKLIGISLLDYRAGEDTNFKKFLVDSLLSSYKLIKEELQENHTELRKQIAKESKENKLKKLKIKEDKISKFINFNEFDEILSGLSFNEHRIGKYLKVRGNVNSLYKIHSIIESLRHSFTENKIADIDKPLAFQRVLHITGEFLKDTEATPNILPDVKNSLEKSGIPAKILSKFRDLLAHYHIFPLIEENVEQIQRLFEEGFLPIQNIIEEKIAKTEKDFIQSIIEDHKTEAENKSLAELLELKSNESLKELLQLTERIKMTNMYTSIEGEPEKLNSENESFIDTIHQNLQQMKSKDFYRDEEKLTKETSSSKESKFTELITEYINQNGSEKNKVKDYEKLYSKLDLDDVASAHDDVLKITEAINYLGNKVYPLPDNSFLDNFLEIKVLEKINLKVNGELSSLKKELEKYFDADSFKSNKLFYYDFKNSEPKTLIQLLKKIIRGSNDTKLALIKFFESNKDNYIPPNEYELLVSKLNVDKQYKNNIAEYQEALLLYSVEWRRKKCTKLLEKNPPALKKLYDTIIEGEMIEDDVYKNLASEYSFESFELLAEKFADKIQSFYIRRITEEIDLLKTVKHPYAVEAQIVNIYSLLEKAKAASGSVLKVNKLRNFLSHGDALISDKDVADISEQLVALKDQVANQLDTSKKITLQNIESVISELQSHISFEGSKRIIELLCPIDAATEQSLHMHGARRRRYVSRSCLTWEDIDKFNEGGFENRDPDNITIDSKKFISSISNDLDTNEEKFYNFIALADGSEVVGDHTNKVIMLTDNHRYLDHLERIGKVSGIVMHGVIAKDIVGELLRGDYKDVVINLSFLAGSLGLAKVAEVASMKGAGYILKGRALLGTSLRLSSPFLSRAVTAFIAYDLYNQVKDFKKGNKDALVPIIGDSIQLGVDSVSFGIEVGEALGLELLEGVSAVTGPIGMAVGALIFIGTDIYMAVRTVQKIDEQIHLTGWEKFSEGLLAFFDNRSPPEYIKKLIEEKNENNKLVKYAIDFLKENTYIKKYVFPSIKIVSKSNKQNENDYLVEIILDNEVFLDKKRYGLKWIRARPDNPIEANLFCLPKGEWENAPNSGTYECKNAIGVEYTNNQITNRTLISLGNGQDKAVGFQDSSNVFLLGEGHKVMVGGNEDDLFVFQGKDVNEPVFREIKGFIDGCGGTDTIDVGGLNAYGKGSKKEGNYTVSVDFIQGVLNYTPKVAFNVHNINKFLGRKDRVDEVVCGCDTKHVDGKGGGNNNYLDSIIIPQNDTCSYYTKVIVNPYTKVTNNANKGNFVYFVKGEKGKEAYIDLVAPSQSKNMCAFNYTLKEVAAIDKSKQSITFTFADEFSNRQHKIDLNNSFKLTVSSTKLNITTYDLIDSTKIVMGEKYIYVIQNTEKPIDSIINNYFSIAERLKTYVFVHSNNEVLAIGHSHGDVLMNDPKAKASHLVGNGGENIYVITSGQEKLSLLNLPLSNVIIYDLDRENKSDTLDLRTIKAQVKKDLDQEIHTEISKIGNDLLINLSFADVSKREIVNIRLKDSLQNNWYKRLHIVIDSVFIIEEILDNFELTPQPLIFDDNNKSIYVINPEDVTKGNIIRVKKEIGDYTFARDNDALVITNSLRPNVDKNKISSVILNDFFYEESRNKMQSLKVEFNDKKILLRRETKNINDAENFIKLKRKCRFDRYKAVMNSIKQQEVNEAIEQKSIAMVKELIDHGASIDARNNDGQTLLHYASSKGSLEIVSYLVEKMKMAVNVKDYLGRTPLHFAAKSGNLHVVMHLIKQTNADANVTNNVGQTPLHYAAFGGSIEVVKYLIEEAETGSSVKSNTGQTPLHYAAIHGNLELVKYLIGGKSADFNVEDNSGRTPLHYAAFGGNLVVLKYLIKNRKVVVDVKSNTGETPLHYAAKCGNTDVVKYLIEEKITDATVKDDTGQTPLHSAASNGRLDVVRYLVDERRIDFNIKDFVGQTPLHSAAMGGRLEIAKYFKEGKDDFYMNGYMGHLYCDPHNDKIKVAKYLIEEKGTDFNAKAKYGKIPLHYASHNGNLEMVKYLVEVERADYNSKDDLGCTSLFYAAESSELDVVKYLVEEQGADISIVDNAGKTLLHHCAISGKLEVVKYLTEKGADINARDNLGLTPLYSAANNAEMEIVKYLIKKGAQIDLNIYGETPLNILQRKVYKHDVGSIVKTLTQSLFDAVKYDDFAEVQGLINQGVIVIAKNSDKQELLNFAIFYDKLKIVKYLIQKKIVESNVKLGDVRMTLLHLAALNGKLEIVKYLIEEKRAAVNEKDGSGQVALHYAAANGKLEVVKYLVEKGADFRGTCNSVTPMDVAAYNGHGDIVEYLQIRFNVERVEPQGYKPCHKYGNRNRRHISHRAFSTDTRHQIEIATSNASQKHTSINDLFGWVRNFRGKLNHKPQETSSTASSVSPVNIQIDANGTILLLDLLFRRITGQQYIPSENQQLSLIEAQGYALNIVERFEKISNKAALKSGMSPIDFNFNPVKIQLAIVGQIRNGNFAEISKTLYSYAKEECLEVEQKGKFLGFLKSYLEEFLSKEKLYHKKQKKRSDR